MFGIDRDDPQHALGRRRIAICHLCGCRFDIPPSGSAICEGCIAREPTPLQDNDSEHGSNWIRPREHPEITVARIRQIEAELKAHRFFYGAWFLHNILSSIAGAPERPLRLLPKDQHKLARSALELFEENFPDLRQMMDLLPSAESPTVGPKRGL